MNRAVRNLRCVLALAALLAYELLPVLGFVHGGVTLYLAGGLTLGLFFASWLLVPLIALAALCLTAWMRRRGLRLTLALIALLSLGLAGIWIAWLPAPVLPVDASWLLTHATALRAVLEQAGEMEDAALLKSAWAAGMPQPAWGYWIALGCTGLATLLCLKREEV